MNRLDYKDRSSDYELLCKGGLRWGFIEIVIIIQTARNKITDPDRSTDGESKLDTAAVVE